MYLANFQCVFCADFNELRVCRYGTCSLFVEYSTSTNTVHGWRTGRRTIENNLRDNNAQRCLLPILFAFVKPFNLENTHQFPYGRCFRFRRSPLHKQTREKKKRERVVTRVTFTIHRSCPTTSHHSQTLERVPPINACRSYSFVAPFTFTKTKRHNIQNHTVNSKQSFESQQSVIKQ